MKARVELRLIPMALFQDPMHEDQLPIAQDLPYERALRYVDGTLVTIVKPGSLFGRTPAPERQVPSAYPSVCVATRVTLGRPEDEDLVEAFSFV
jgi:hypothetical protein